MWQLKKSNNKLQKYLLATTSITAMFSSIPAAGTWADINGGDQYISNDLTLDPAIVYSTDHEARFVDGYNNTGGAILNSTGSNYKGTLRFNGTHDFRAGLNGNKDVGAPGAALKLIQLDGGWDKAVQLAGNIYSDEIKFINGATMQLSDSATITANNITTASADWGVLYLLGNSTITSNTGSAIAPLKHLDIQGTGTTVTVSGDTYINNIKIYDSATLELSGNNTYQGTFFNNSTGKIKLSQSGSATVNGTFSDSFDSITVASTGTTTFNTDVKASVLDFSADGTVIMADGSNLVLGASGISNSSGSAGKGSLVFLGNSTVDAPIGTTNRIYGAYLAGPSGKTVEFQDQADIYYITFNHPTDAGIRATADSTLVLSANKTHTVTITTANNNQGTMKFTNSGSARIVGYTGTTNERMKEIIVDDASDGSATDITFNDTYTNTFSFNTDSTIRFYQSAASTHSLVTTNGIKNTRGDGTNVGTIDNNHNAVALYGDIGESGAGKGLKMIKNSSTTAGTWISDSVYATDMHFAADSTIKLTAASANSTIDITNGITTATGSTGVLELANSANTITFTGDIGGHVVSTGASDTSKTLKKVLVSGTGISYAQGNIYADVLDFSADGTVTISDGKNLVLGASGVSNSGVDGKGNLIFLGTSTVNAPIGTTARIYGAYLAGPAGKTVEFQDQSDIYYIMFDHPTTPALAAAADGTLIFSASKTNATAVETANNGQGTVILKNTGANIITGWLGASGKNLREVRLDDSSNGTGASIETANIYADVVNFNTDSTIKSYQIVPATISITATNGIKNMKGGSNIGTIDNVKDIDNPWIITGNIGASGAGNGIKMVKNTTATAHTTITGNIYATDMYFGADSTMKLTAGSANSTINITNGITTATGSTGVLELANSTNTLTFTNDVGGKVVSTGAADTSKTLKSITISAAGSSEFQGNIYTDKIDLTGGSDASLTFSGASKTYSLTGVDLAGQDNKGALIFTGSSPTITSSIGTSATNRLKSLDFKDATGTGSISGAVYAKSISVGNINLSFASSINTGASGSLAFSNDGNITLADGANLTSAVTNSTGNNGRGTINFTGSSTASSALGASSAALKAINLNGGSSNNVTFQGDIYATKLNFAGGNTKATINSSNFDSLVTTSNNGQGELYLYSNLETKKAIGEADKLVSKLAIGDGSTAYTITLNEDIYAKELQINSKATLKLNKNITANVTESVTMGANSVLDLGKNTFTIKGDSNDGINAASVTNVKSTIYKDGIKYAMGGINNNTNTASPIDVSNFVLNITFDTPLPNNTEILFAKFLSTNTTLTGIEGTKLESLSNITKFKLTYGDDGKSLYLRSIREQTLNNHITNSGSVISSKASALANLLERNLSTVTRSAAQIIVALETLPSEKARQLIERLAPNNLGSDAIAQAVTSGISSTQKRVASLISSDSLINSLGVASGNSYIDIGPWSQIFASKSEQKKYKEIDSATTYLKGISVGNDWQITDNFLAGTGVTILNTKSKATGTLSGNKADINSFLLNFYSFSNFKQSWFISNAATMGVSKVKSYRITGLDNDLIAKGKTSTYNYSISAGLGYRMKFQDKALLVPKASLSYNVIHSGDLNETGAINENIDFNQKIFGKTAKKLAATLGSSMIFNYSKNNWQVMPEIHANISRTLRGNRPFNKSLIDGLTEVITTREPKEIKQLYNIGTGIILKSATNTEIKAQYDFDIKKKYMSHTGSIKVKIKF